EVLAKVLAEGKLSVSADASTVRDAEHVVVALGTPIDEHFNPDPQALIHALERVADQLNDGQLLVLRSTVFPGVTRMVERLMHRLGKAVDVAFCPERIAEGRAMEELFALPQIVSARTNRSFDRAASLFGHLTDKIVGVAPQEAELATVFTHSDSSLKFAGP